MSVYSGFATRQQESFYNKLNEKLITLLCDRIIQTTNSGIFLRFVKEIQELSVI
jgi:hypothetical protein